MFENFVGHATSVLNFLLNMFKIQHLKPKKKKTFRVNKIDVENTLKKHSGNLILTSSKTKFLARKMQRCTKFTKPYIQKHVCRYVANLIALFLFFLLPSQYRFIMNIKLFSVMGISWLLEIISTLYNQDSMWWYISDVFNCLQGVLVFFVFVFKRKVLVAFQKKLGKQKK